MDGVNLLEFGESYTRWEIEDVEHGVPRFAIISQLVFETDDLGSSLDRRTIVDRINNR